MAATFQEIGRRVRNGGWDEWGVRQWIGEAFGREHLVTDDLPIVGVNENAGNPHYEPTADCTRRIHPGDLVLLDMWAKKDTPDAVYYDITWTGVLGEPSAKHREVFGIVRDARKAGSQRVIEAFAAGQRIEGWEVDEAARGVIDKAGYGEWFVHRTGHSIGKRSRQRGKYGQPGNERYPTDFDEYAILGRAGNLSAGVWRAQRSRCAGPQRRGAGNWAAAGRVSDFLNGNEKTKANAASNAALNEASRKQA